MQKTTTPKSVIFNKNMGDLCQKITELNSEFWNDNCSSFVEYPMPFSSYEDLFKQYINQNHDIIRTLICKQVFFDSLNRSQRAQYHRLYNELSKEVKLHLCDS